MDIDRPASRWSPDCSLHGSSSGEPHTIDKYFTDHILTQIHRCDKNLAAHFKEQFKNVESVFRQQRRLQHDFDGCYVWLSGELMRLQTLSL